MRTFLYTRITALLSLIFILIGINSKAQTKTDNAKMDAFVSSLMSKMTLDEKIGQLNLVVSGPALTGTTVNAENPTR